MNRTSPVFSLSHRSFPSASAPMAVQYLFLSFRAAISRALSLAACRFSSRSTSSGGRYRRNDVQLTLPASPGTSS